MKEHRLNRITSRRWLTPLASFLLLLSGCVTLDGGLIPAGPPAPGTPAQVIATWQPEVYFAPDPAHNGDESPTLVGRVYLFGPEIKYPMAGDGSLVVDMYEGAVQPGSNVSPLEEWRFDPTTFHNLLKRDAIGWGYSVPLSWGTYRPDITRVQLRVRYDPAKGTPLYAQSSSMALNNPYATPTASPNVTTSARPQGPFNPADARAGQTETRSPVVAPEAVVWPRDNSR